VIAASMITVSQVIAKDGQIVYNAIDAMKKEGIVMIESPLVSREKCIPFILSCTFIQFIQLNHFISTKHCATAEVSTTVNFEIHYNTVFGEILFVVGSIDELGNWDPMLGKKMEWTDGVLSFI
jgi:hypothetical protein